MESDPTVTTVLVRIVHHSWKSITIDESHGNQVDLESPTSTCLHNFHAALSYLRPFTCERLHRCLYRCKFPFCVNAKTYFRLQIQSCLLLWSVRFKSRM